MFSLQIKTCQQGKTCDFCICPLPHHVSHHILHVGGCRVNAASQLVVQLQDLLTVRPENGSPSPVPSGAVHAGLVVFLLVAAQQLSQFLGVGQEEGKRVRDTEQEEERGKEPSHSRVGHSDTVGCLGRPVRLQ